MTVGKCPIKDATWTWITGIDSAIARPNGWFARESTIEYPWDEVTGNPLRTYYITKEDVQKRFHYSTGLSIASYCIDRQQGRLKDLAKNKQTNEFVNGVLVPARLFEQKELGTEAPAQPQLNPDIEVLKKKVTHPNFNHRIPAYSTRVSYNHNNYVPDGFLGYPPTDMRFEVEWLAEMNSGWIFEIVFQAPQKEWENTWSQLGRVMTRHDFGMYLRWR